MNEVEHATLAVAGAITLLHLLGVFVEELGRVARRIVKTYRMLKGN